MKNLAGKFAVVTGCGKGIGASIVKKFLEEDIAGVAMLEYDEALVNATAKEMDPDLSRLLPIRCDVSNGEDVKKAIAQAKEKFGRVDILVNNAGITRDGMFHKMTEAQWDAFMKVNLKSMFFTCREVIPMMRENKYGKIVNISSLSALGNVGQANYAATKAGIQGMTKTLAKENGPKNINVNAVCPGFINTDMFKAVPQETLDAWKADIPMKRFAEPSEIASIVCFFASDESSWITGQCIYASGGKMF